MAMTVPLAARGRENFVSPQFRYELRTASAESTALNDSGSAIGVRYRLSRAANGMIDPRLMKPTLLLVLFTLCFPAYGQRTQSAAKNLYFEAPFELVKDEIVLAVRIAGKGPFNFLLDTDTDPSAIDLATAKELGLSLGAQGYPASGGGTAPLATYLTRLPLVEVGGLVAKDVSAGAVDLTKLANRLGKPIHGLLGYSFLKDRIVQIDYLNSKISFYAETPYPGIQFAANTVNRIAVPFRYDGGVLIDTVFVNGQKLRATLDTGSSGTFTLTPQATALLKLDEELRDAPLKESVGYNGALKSKVGILKSVRIGRLSIEGAPASFWLPETGHDREKYDINIGNGFFKEYVVTFDFRNKLVVFDQP